MDTNNQKPWINESGEVLSDEEIKSVSKDWTPETWEAFLSATVDVESHKKECRHENYTELVDEQTESFLNRPCRVPIQIKSQLEIAIRKLPPVQRSIVRGIFYHGKSVSRIAREMKISPQAVRQGKVKSLRKIKRLLESEVSILNYLIGGHEFFGSQKRTRDEDIREVYRTDLRGSYLK